MINVAENEILLRCTCHSADHIAFLKHEMELGHPEHDCWYLTLTLDNDGFWRRLFLSLKFIFAPNRIRYGGMAELVLTNNDVDDLARFIAKRRAETNVSSSTPYRDAADDVNGIKRSS